MVVVCILGTAPFCTGKRWGRLVVVVVVVVGEGGGSEVREGDRCSAMYIPI